MKHRFVKVQIENISIFNYNFIILLRRDGDDRVLPICIGPAEAHSIAIAYNNKPYRRPLTHDLMKSVLDEIDCTVDRVHVTDLKDGTFYARVYLTTWDGRTLDIDSRPSDAMALALRYEAPIFVREDVLTENSVDIKESDQQLEQHMPITDEGDAPTERETPRDPVSRLKQQLEDAVSDERYEDAARLRDELQRLQGN